MRIYTAGPMTGLPQFNFPAFDRAAGQLRAEGHDVVSPAELDSPEHRAIALASHTGDPREYTKITGETWGDLLARDVKLIADGGIERIYVLPGWERSKGARLETYIAHLTGIEIHFLDGGEVPMFRKARAWTHGNAWN